MDTTIQSATTNGQLVTGLFPDRDSAERAYSGITGRGYDKNDVNVVMSDDTRHRYFTTTSGKETELGNKAAEGAGIGGAIGGAVVGIAAAVAAIGSNLILPGLGLVIAGPLAAGVAGAGAGAMGGGLIGALVGWAMPEERVKHYEEGIKKGGILMGVRAKNDEDAAHFENAWRSGNGQHVYR
jgi:hypothetical protein